MPTKTIKARGYSDFKISEPLDAPRELKKAIAEAKRADQLAEFAHMRLESVRHQLKEIPHPEARAMVDRLDHATEYLSDSRLKLGDTVYQVERVLADANEA